MFPRNLLDITFFQLCHNEPRNIDHCNKYCNKNQPVDNQNCKTSEHVRTHADVSSAKLIQQTVVNKKHLPTVVCCSNYSRAPIKSILFENITLLGSLLSVQFLVHEIKNQHRRPKDDTDDIVQSFTSPRQRVVKSSENIDELITCNGDTSCRKCKLIQDQHRNDVFQADNKSRYQGTLLCNLHIVARKNTSHSTLHLVVDLIHGVTCGFINVRHIDTSIFVWRFCTALQKFTKLLKLLCARTQDIIIVTYLHNFVKHQSCYLNMVKLHLKFFHQQVLLHHHLDAHLLLLDYIMLLIKLFLDHLCLRLHKMM